MLNKEWESKVIDQDMENQKKLTQITCKHKLELKQIQNDVQKAYEENLLEIENESQAQLEKSKQECEHLKVSLEKMQNEFISHSRHEEILNAELDKLKENYENEIRDITERYNNEDELQQLSLDNQNLQQALAVEKDTVRELLAKLDHTQNDANNIK